MEDKRGERRKRWWLLHGEGREARRSMARRNGYHDYRSRRIYMVTIAVQGRRAVLGSLQGPDESHAQAWVRPSALGERGLRC